MDLRSSSNMFAAIKMNKNISTLISMIVIICLGVVMQAQQQTEAKLLHRSRSYYDDNYNNGYEGPYGGGLHGLASPMGAATGERAILTVRGTRNPYDGSAPSKITIEDNPYRGPYPRGIYDRLDSDYGRRPMYPRHLSDGYGYSNLGLGGGYGGYNSG